MTMSFGPNLGVLVDGALGEQHFANLMTQWRGLDGLIQCHVKDKDLAAPPASPANGDMYIVAASPTGAWASHAGELAYYYIIPANGSNGASSTSGWQFFTPKKGWRTHVEDESVDYQYNGSAWVIAASGGGGSSNATQSVTSSAGVLDLSGTTASVILVTLTENVTSVVMPSGVVDQSIERRIVFTQGGSGGYQVAGWSGVSVEGGGSVPPVVPALGSVTNYVLVNDSNTGWRMFVDQVSGSTFKNRLINGNFQVNQRGVSGTVVLAAGQYGHDRWKAGASGCTYTFSSANGITTIDISAGSLQQVIEGNNLQTGTYVLSWSGTAQGKIASDPYGASGITSSVAGGSNLTVEFGVGTFSLAQLEIGSIATQFENRHIGFELSLCERYYECAVPGDNAAISFDGNVTSGLAYSARTRFRTQKRATPTISVTNAAAFNFPTTTGSITSGVKGFSETRTANGSGTANFQSLWTASAEL